MLGILVHLSVFRYGVPVERKVTIKNMSKVCLVFGCKPKAKQLVVGTLRISIRAHSIGFPHP